MEVLRVTNSALPVPLNTHQKSIARGILISKVQSAPEYCAETSQNSRDTIWIVAYHGFYKRFGRLKYVIRFFTKGAMAANYTAANRTVILFPTPY